MKKIVLLALCIGYISGLAAKQFTINDKTNGYRYANGHFDLQIDSGDKSALTKIENFPYTFTADNNFRLSYKWLNKKTTVGFPLVNPNVVTKEESNWCITNAYKPISEEGTYELRMVSPQDIVNHLNDPNYHFMYEYGKGGYCVYYLKKIS